MMATMRTVLLLALSFSMVAFAAPCSTSVRCGAIVHRCCCSQGACCCRPAQSPAPVRETGSMAAPNAREEGLAPVGAAVPARTLGDLTLNSSPLFAEAGVPASPRSTRSACLRC